MHRGRPLPSFSPCGEKLAIALPIGNSLSGKAIRRVMRQTSHVNRTRSLARGDKRGGRSARAHRAPRMLYLTDHTNVFVRWMQTSGERFSATRRAVATYNNFARPGTSNNREPEVGGRKSDFGELSRREVSSSRPAGVGFASLLSPHSFPHSRRSRRDSAGGQSSLSGGSFIPLQGWMALLYPFFTPESKTKNSSPSFFRVLCAFRGRLHSGSVAGATIARQKPSVSRATFWFCRARPRHYRFAPWKRFAATRCAVATCSDSAAAAPLARAENGRHATVARVGRAAITRAISIRQSNDH